MKCSKSICAAVLAAFMIAGLSGGIAQAGAGGVYTVEAENPVPLEPELEAYTRYEAHRNGVPFPVVLAVMEQESRFTLDADSGDSYGIMQINRIHGPREIIMEPHENIRIGCWLLGYLYKEYGRWDMSLTAYNWGQEGATLEYFQYGIASSPYSKEVMQRWARWAVLLNDDV